MRVSRSIRLWRAALGAGRGRVVAQLLTESLVLASIGGVVAVGITAALIAVVLVSLGLAAAALLACYVPARRALGINPIVALRAE